MPTRPPIHRPYGAKSREQAERERKRALARARAAVPWARWYNRAVWRRLRVVQLNRQPLCEDCLVADPPRITAATEVDHEKPHRGDWALFADPKNLKSRCKPCHSRKTATEDSGFARKG